MVQYIDENETCRCRGWSSSCFWDGGCGRKRLNCVVFNGNGGCVFTNEKKPLLFVDFTRFVDDVVVQSGLHCFGFSGGHICQLVFFFRFEQLNAMGVVC